jgi:uncharacterized protein YigE (DUF2233 family)
MAEPQRFTQSLLLGTSLIVALGSDAAAVEFAEARSAGKRLTVCRVNVRKERLQLFLRDDTLKRSDFRMDLGPIIGIAE